jgi:hypothetical protein
MPALDTALEILSSGSVGLTQARFQELQLALAKMELETKRETMREDVLWRKEQRQRENALYALDTSEKFLKEEKFNAAQSVIGNLVGILPEFKEDMTMKQIKRQLRDNVPDELLQNKIASIVFNYYSESEASQLAAIESATNLSEYIDSEYRISKSRIDPKTGDYIATAGLGGLITAGLIDRPKLSDGTDNPNFEASVVPYSLLSKTKDIKRNIAQERAEIGAGDYTIQEDILLPTEMEAAFEALAVGTDNQYAFNEALKNLGAGVGGEEIRFADGSPGEISEDYNSNINELNELESQRNVTRKLVDEGFGGTSESDLKSLNEAIDEKREYLINKRFEYEQASRQVEIEELAADLDIKAKQNLAAAGLQETAENIKAMKDKIRRETPSPGSQIAMPMDEAFRAFAAGQQVYRE